MSGDPRRRLSFGSSTSRGKFNFSAARGRSIRRCATLEHVFDDWPVVRPQRPTRRLVSPPCRVVVNLLTGLPNRLADFRDVALFTRVDGLELTRPRVGVLVAWVPQTSGRWWGLVELEFVTGSGRGRLRVRQLFPASALTPAPAEPGSSTSVRDRSG